MLLVLVGAMSGWHTAKQHLLVKVHDIAGGGSHSGSSAEHGNHRGTHGDIFAKVRRRNEWWMCNECKRDPKLVFACKKKGR